MVEKANDAPNTEDVLATLIDLLDDTDRHNQSPGCFRSAQLREATGWNQKRRARFTQAARDAGFIKATMVRFTDDWNVTQHTRGYQFTQKFYDLVGRRE